MRRDGKGAEGRDGRAEADVKKAMEVKEKEICPYGITCWFGALGCCKEKHGEKDYMHFDRKAKMREIEAEIRCEEAKMPCSWCRRNCCRYGTKCRKGLMVDSGYESAEDDAMEDEATVKEELKKGQWETVRASAPQQAGGQWSGSARR